MTTNTDPCQALGSGFESQSTQASREQTSASAVGNAAPTVTRGVTRPLLAKVCRRVHGDDDVIGRSWFLLRLEPEEWTTDRHAGAVWEWAEAEAIARRLQAFPVVVEPESGAVIGCLESASPRAMRRRGQPSVREYQKRLEALKLA